MVTGCVTEKIVEKEVEKIVYRDKETPTPPASPAPPARPNEEPLTSANLERLLEMPDFTNIRNYQFVLVNEITLDNVINDRNDHTNSPPKGAIFENVRNRNQITFPDKALGQAAGDVSVVGDKYVLRVCFESPADEGEYPAATHYLVFSARRSEQTAYFFLEHDDPRPDTLSDEKGTLRYGSDTYTLMYNERPYLLHRLERKTGGDELKRTVKGREIR